MLPSLQGKLRIEVMMDLENIVMALVGMALFLLVASERP